MITVTSFVDVMRMGNIMPRAALKSTSLTFRASVLPLHHIGSLMSPLYPCPPVYAASCLRGQCRLLQYLEVIAFRMRETVASIQLSMKMPVFITIFYSSLKASRWAIIETFISTELLSLIPDD